MWHPKLRGYMYQIVEEYPHEDGYTLTRKLHTYDRLEDAESVLKVLEENNYNFTCYGITLFPVWEQDKPKPHQFDMIGWSWDANGSPVL